MNTASATKSAAAFAVSPAFVESMRPKTASNIGRIAASFAQPAHLAKLTHLGGVVAGLTARTNSIVFEHAGRLASARVNWSHDLAQIGIATQHLREQFSGVSAILEKMRPFHERLALHGEAISRAMSECHASLLPSLTNLEGVLQSRVAPWAQIGASMVLPAGLQQWHESIAHTFSQWSSITKAIGSIVHAYPTDEEFVPLHDHLLSQSWYLSLDVHAAVPVRLLTLLEAGDTEAIDELLAAQTRENLNDIELALIAQYPDRRRVVEDAFNAHRNGLFTLSIPALLLLADGIAHSIWQVPFFCSRQSTLLIRRRLMELGEQLALHTWLRPLVELGAIREHSTRLPATNTPLNRHNVMHGLRADYASELNGLKAISLLEYIRSVSFIFEAASDSTEA